MTRSRKPSGDGNPLQPPVLDRRPVLAETPFYQHIQEPGLRIALDVGGKAMQPPRMPPLEETFVRVPFPLSRLKNPARCLHEESFQTFIDLPVGRDSDGFYYAHGWILPTLAESGAEGLHNIAAILRDWSTHARPMQQLLGRPLTVADLLVVHPHTRRSAWRTMLQSRVFSDTQMIGLFKNRGLLRVGDADRLSAVPGLLDQVLVDQRPYLADFLWRHGARALSAAALFHAAVPNAYLYAVNLGHPSAPFGTAQLQRVAALGQFAGLSVAQAILCAGKTWRTRFHEALGQAPVPRLEVERQEKIQPHAPVSGAGDGDAVQSHRESWSLTAWLLRHANLATVPGGVLPFNAFTRDIQEALLEDRMAWLRWALEHGCGVSTLPEALPPAAPATLLPVSRRAGDPTFDGAPDLAARMEATIREYPLSTAPAPASAARRRA